MPDTRLLLISGSLRAGSFNRKLMHEAARHFGGESAVADIRFPLYDGDAEEADGIPEIVQTVARQIEAADAVVIACPEYNQSLSGVMKNALDWISRVDGNPWKDKPVAIMSAAAGRAGGARSQFALRLAMVAFRSRLVSGPEIMIANASGEFDDNGQLTSDWYTKELGQLMENVRTEISRTNNTD